MAMAFLFTTRGIPQIYYGTEILMDGNKGASDGNVRRDFPGGWPGDSVNAFNPEGRTATQNEAFDFLRRLLHWRAGNDAVRFGTLTHYIVENGVYVYFRKYKNQTVMVLLNNNDKKVQLNTAKFAENLKGYSAAKSVLTREYFDNPGVITLPAKSPLILEWLK